MALLYRCVYCVAVGVSPAMSKGDFVLRFSSGRNYRLPGSLLLHYCLEHRYLPPDPFVSDVLYGTVVSCTGAYSGKDIFMDVGYPDLHADACSLPPNMSFVASLSQILRTWGLADGQRAASHPLLEFCSGNTSFYSAPVGIRTAGAASSHRRDSDRA